MAENRYWKEQEYLNDILDKIKNKIKQTNIAIKEGQKEIDSMHDYYWQNYTEMDQYGYENYDNQQALLGQVNANQHQALLRQRLKSMLKSPYFGRVDFCYEEEDESEHFYIGIGNFAEKRGATPLIYDWRAPVSSLFYDYDQGEASYQAPYGEMKGEITSKWQYKIRDEKIIYAFESDTKIDDDILKAEIAGNSDVKLKNIVRTIQKEQNQIIRNTQDKIMVIQGAAGSGKTSIALHRIAYLLYHDRENLKSSNVLILSPNSIFSDYISHILPELGEENIQEMSFDIFAYRELKSVAEDCEDRYDYLERQLKFPDMEEEGRFRFKQSQDFSGVIESELALFEDELVDFRDIEFKGLKKTEEELIHLFYFRFQNTPLLKRMDSIMEYFVDEYETLRNRDITEEEAEYIQTMFDRLYLTKDIYKIYNHILEDAGYQSLANVSYERRKIPYEDVYPMLYLKYRLCGKTVKKEIRHLVIDEMQDYTYLQYTILHDIFHCRMTILGDRAQTLDDQMRDVLRFLPDIYGKELRKIVLQKSYRNTVEIAEYAASILGVQAPILLDRHGKEVEETEVLSLDMLVKDIMEKIDCKYETMAVLAMTEEEAYEWYHLLKKEIDKRASVKENEEEKELVVSYVDRNSSSYAKGITVTTYYLAKGLEFDQVFAAFSKKDHPYCKQAAYISATRALHELYMYKLR